MSTTIRPALTAEEWAEHEFDSRYGVCSTSLSVDHSGRVFASSEGPRDRHDTVILNEGKAAGEVLPKVAALALHALSVLGLGGFTRKDVELLRKWFTWDVTCDAKEDEARLGTSLADRIAALLPPEDE